MGFQLKPQVFYVFLIVFYGFSMVFLWFFLHVFYGFSSMFPLNKAAHLCLERQEGLQWHVPAPDLEGWDKNHGENLKRKNDMILYVYIVVIIITNIILLFI